MDFPARVGTAFHRTLQSFYDRGLPRSREGAVKEARSRFEQELRRQVSEAAKHPREQSLPYDSARVDRAVEALVLEAVRFVDAGFFPISSPSLNELSSSYSGEQPGQLTSSNASIPVEVEVKVRSNDGYFEGRVDRAEHTPDGTVLYDFKSALRADLPGRYQRQIQLYALMWHDTRGDWPIAGYVVYPLTGKTYTVSLDPAVCLEVAKESVSIIEKLQNEASPANLALPGDICTVCEYRPWCKPFWDWQAEEKSQVRALDRASLGFAGVITRLDLLNHRWHLVIAWRGASVRLTAPEERLPQLRKAQLGQTVLVFDTKMQGTPFSPLAVFNEYSELFVLES